MVPELGNFALILAFCLSILLGVLPMIGAARGNVIWMGLARPLTAGVFVFLSISLFILGYSFVTDDFSVQFVANHSNTMLPIYYKITAVWGGHEGSFLFWTWMLGGWMLAVAIFSKAMPDEFVARVLAIMGLICVGYTLFMLATSNPFDRVLPLPPADGADLNAALQDFAFIIHPPSLYMGYVGFSVVFAFAIAALISGRLDSAWARWCRPWANAAWAILTLGLSLGSWWAYYELGWGGWWAWDPVENPPMITWLLGAAMIHSLAATEKTWCVQKLDCTAGHHGICFQLARHIYYAFGLADISTCLRHGSDSWCLYSGISGTDYRGVAGAVCHSCTHSEKRIRVWFAVARSVFVGKQYDPGGCERRDSAGHPVPDGVSGCVWR